MSNEELLEQIGKLLTPLIADVAHIRTNVSHIKTAVEAIGAGQEDLQEQVKTMSENMATKPDVQDIKVELVKHQRRIENVEESTSTLNTHKTKTLLYHPKSKHQTFFILRLTCIILA